MKARKNSINIRGDCVPTPVARGGIRGYRHYGGRAPKSLECLHEVKPQGKTQGLRNLEATGAVSATLLAAVAMRSAM